MKILQSIDFIYYFVNFDDCLVILFYHNPFRPNHLYLLFNLMKFQKYIWNPIKKLQNIIMKEATTKTAIIIIVHRATNFYLNRPN